MAKIFKMNGDYQIKVYSPFLKGWLMQGPRYKNLKSATKDLKMWRGLN